MFVGGCAVVRLGAEDDVGHAVVVLQDLLEMPEETLGAFLAVGDEADGLARERIEARRELADRRLGAGRGIENSESHGVPPTSWAARSRYTRRSARSPHGSCCRARAGSPRRSRRPVRPRR